MGTIQTGQRWKANNVSVIITDIQDRTANAIQLDDVVWLKIVNSGEFSKWDLDIPLKKFKEMISAGEIWLDQN